MRNKIIILLLLCISLIFSGCFSPWAGGEEGVLTIGIGARSLARDAGFPVSNGPQWYSDLPLNRLLHIVTITGPGGQSHEKRFIGSNSSASFTVATGNWHIDIKAYEDYLCEFIGEKGELENNIDDLDIANVAFSLVAEYSGNINVKPGNNTVEAKMRQPDNSEVSESGKYDITVGVITGQNGWLDINYDAKGSITYGYVNLSYLNHQHEYQKLYEGYGNDNKPPLEWWPFDYNSTVKIEAIPHPGGVDGGSFSFVKWVLLGKSSDYDDHLQDGKAILLPALEIDKEKVGPTINTTVIEIARFDSRIANSRYIRLIAVFEGNGFSDKYPKNITHNGTGDGGLKSMEMDKHYALMTNLDLHDWTPIGDGTVPFTVSFNGMGHKINFTGTMGIVNNSSVNPVKCAGLFGVIGGGGTVKNLYIQGSISLSNNGNNLFVGAVAGENNSGTIKNVVSRVDFQVNGTNSSEICVGGIAGKTTENSNINNCASTGQIVINGNEGNFAGGIVGYSAKVSTINYCWASGGIYANNDNGCGGGIVGKKDDNCTIKNCLAVNTIIVAKTKGRILGDNSDTPIGNLKNNYANVNEMTVAADLNGKDGASVSNASESPGTGYGSSAWWTDTTKWDGGAAWALSNKNPPTSEDTPWIFTSSYLGNSNNPPIKLWFNRSY
jgi:hypothetical protein